MKRFYLLGVAAVAALIFGTSPAWAAKPQVMLSAGNTQEGGSAQLTVSANAKITGSVTVSLSDGSANGTASCPASPGVQNQDYVNTALVFTFASAKSVTRLLPTCDDNWNEGTETLTATITSVSVTGGASIGSKKQQTISISDNDPVTATISPTNDTAVEGVTVPGGTFTVNLSNPSKNAVTVNWTTADGTAVAGEDYTAKSGSLTFLGFGGPFEVSKPIPTAIPTFDDGKWSATDETFNVNLSTSSPGVSVGGSSTEHLGEIGTMPNITVTDATNVEGGVIDFTVTKHGGSDSGASINFATQSAGLPPGHATGGSACDPGIDYVSQSGTLTFAAGGDATQHVLVQSCQDTEVEPDETFNLAFSGAVGASPPGSAATGTIQDDEPGALTLSGSNAGGGIVAHVTNTSGTLPLNGVLVRFEQYGYTSGSNFNAIDLTGPGGAGYDLTGDGVDVYSNVIAEQPGDASLPFTFGDHGEVSNKFVACVVVPPPSSTANQAVAACGLAGDPDANPADPSDLTGWLTGDNTNVDSPPAQPATVNLIQLP